MSSSASVCSETDQRLDEHTWNGDIHVVGKAIEYNEPQNFNPVCVDSGADVMVIGMHQEELYSKLSGTRLKPVKSNRLYKFGGKNTMDSGL